MSSDQEFDLLSNQEYARANIGLIISDLTREGELSNQNLFALLSITSMRIFELSEKENSPIQTDEVLQDPILQTTARSYSLMLDYEPGGECKLIKVPFSILTTPPEEISKYLMRNRGRYIFFQLNTYSDFIPSAASVVFDLSTSRTAIFEIAAAASNPVEPLTYELQSKSQFSSLASDVLPTDSETGSLKNQQILFSGILAKVNQAIQSISPEE